ncbi:MAG: ceramidase domain-containing protein [Actinomycetota bacterium]
MTLGEHVFLYCERGTSGALLAEPINAASNGAFVLAALAGLALVLLRPRESRSADHYLLVGLVLLIGLGSLAFHLYATTGTELADVLPIGIFMLVYFGFALNRFLGVPVGWAMLLVIGFTALMAANMQVKCWDGGIGIPGPEVQGVKPCLNGSLFYLPALGVLIVVGLLLEERRHRAAPYLLWAAAILAVSVTLRTLDMALCDKVVIEGRKIGTHFAWHILNAVALFLLLRASLEDSPDAVRAIAAGPVEAEDVRPAQPRGEATGDDGGEASVKRPALSERVASTDGAAQEETAPQEEAGEEGESKTLLPA